jgi:hypothetical protein
MKQLNVVKVEYLTMHMLVLFANTGVDMDLRQQGYIIDRMADIFPKSAYTPCIEEHNIHAIFRWECFLDIFHEYEKQQSVGRVAVLMSADTGAPTSVDTGVFPCVPLISLPVGLGEQKFLHNTGLTMSITTLGTCIYRVGTKRIKIDNVVRDTSVRGGRAGGGRGDEASGTSQATRNSSSHVHPSQLHLTDNTIPSEYSDVTEQFIFDMCKYVQLVLVS